MSHKTSLRQSFVVTYALASSLAAVAHADPPHNPQQCAATYPVEGSRCSRPNLRCGYQVCYDYFTQTAVCDPRTRRWHREPERTCNPPPPPPVGVNPPTLPQPTVNPPPPPRPPMVNPPPVPQPTVNPPPPPRPPHGNPPPPSHIGHNPPAIPTP